MIGNPFWVFREYWEGNSVSRMIGRLEKEKDK